MKHIAGVVSVSVVAVLYSGCGNNTVADKPATESTCLNSIPKDIKGLKVRGSRPRQNVIENLAPIICNWQRLCNIENRNDLTGVIILNLVVDKIGDIGVTSYETTIKDTIYVDNLVKGLYLHDFDPWNDQPGETIIEVPVELIK